MTELRMEVDIKDYSQGENIAHVVVTTDVPPESGDYLTNRDHVADVLLPYVQINEDMEHSDRKFFVDGVQVAHEVIDVHSR